MSSSVKTALRNALKKSASATNTVETTIFAPAIATAICRMFHFLANLQDFPSKKFSFYFVKPK